MDKSRFIELLTRKMAGDLSCEEQQELDGLIEKYPDAVYYDDALREVFEPTQVDDVVLEDLYERHKMRHGHKLDFNKTRKLNWLLDGKLRQLVVAASVLCCIGLLISLLLIRNSSSIRAGGFDTEIVAEKGVRKKIILPDGTAVWLNADSKLSYDSGMNESEVRQVMLVGEAFFDVAKNKRKPFVLQTDQMSIKVLGTSFNVKAYPDEEKSETTLIEGSIELSVNSRPDEKIILKPSEKIAITELHKKEQPQDKKGQPQDSPSPDHLTMTIKNISPIKMADNEFIKETSWIQSRLIFQNETMQDLLPKLERWYDVKFIVKDEKIRSYHYTGTFTKETISQALSALQLTKPFNYKIDRDEITLY